LVDYSREQFLKNQEKRKEMNSGLSRAYIVLFLLFFVLVSLPETIGEISKEDKECEALCERHNVIPSLWEGCLDKVSLKTFQNLECFKRMSQSCQAWSRWLEPNPLAPEAKPNWQETCAAVFGKRSDLVLITVANRPAGMFGMMALGALQRSLSVTVVGWDFFVPSLRTDPSKPKPKRHPKFFSGYKIVSIYLLMERCSQIGMLSKDQIIMFVDGTDSLFQQGPEYIMSQLNAMLAHKPIVFSSERDMFPATDWVRQHYPRTYGAPIKTIFGHLNTGGWVGRAGAMRIWYRDWANAPFMSYHPMKGKGKLVLDVPQPTRQIRTAQELWDLRDAHGTNGKLPRCYQVSDQFNAAHMYIQGVGNASVDNWAKLFVSMWIPQKEHSRFFDFSEPGLVKSRRTQTVPAVLHFNGPAKQQYCGATSLTTAGIDVAAATRLLAQSLLDKKLQFLDADLRLLPPGAVKPELLAASLTDRRMVCKKECGQG